MMMKMLLCKECGAGFVAKRQWQRFCSEICQQANYRKSKGKMHLKMHSEMHFTNGTHVIEEIKKQDDKIKELEDKFKELEDKHKDIENRYKKKHKELEDKFKELEKKYDIFIKSNADDKAIINRNFRQIMARLPGSSAQI
jgi:chromosome segregation ATPase